MAAFCIARYQGGTRVSQPAGAVRKLRTDSDCVVFAPMTSSSPLLPDPRQYSSIIPSNMLLSNLGSVLNATNADERQMWSTNLKASLADYLERAEVLPLSVALAMAPSQTAYRQLWQSLCEVVDGEAECASERLFAIPVILVVGSKSQTVLPGVLPDTDGLVELLAQHKLVQDPSRVRILPKLLHPDTVSALSSAILYRLNRSDDVLNGHEIANLPEAPVSINGEAVFLRYLIGAARHVPGQPDPITFGGAVGSWGMPAMEWFGKVLKADGVTLFPIARPPQPLLPAVVAGGRARQEVAMQVFASNRLRKLRELQLNPVAIASSHEGGELRFTLSAEGDDRNWEGFVWPLSPLDMVPQIAQMFAELMADCRVDDVRFVPGVQPDRNGDVPLFFTADDLAPGSASVQ